ncbi:MAG: hypothetical protein HOO95_05960 [Gallionella sp.]|nr:hypothetical protein [Gallionella sp.]
MKTRKPSNKGQVILSTAIFSANQQKTGLEFATTTLDEVVGCTGYVGKSHSIADMHKAITTEIKSTVK